MAPIVAETTAAGVWNVPLSSVEDPNVRRHRQGRDRGVCCAKSSASAAPSPDLRRPTRDRAIRATFCDRSQRSNPHPTCFARSTPWRTRSSDRHQHRTGSGGCVPCRRFGVGVQRSTAVDGFQATSGSWIPTMRRSGANWHRRRPTSGRNREDLDLDGPTLALPRARQG